MKNPIRVSPCLLLVPILVLSACKHKEKPVEPAPVQVAPSVAPVAAAPTSASAPQPAVAPAVTPEPVPAAPAGLQFDVGTVPMSTVALPPFPYVAFPKDASGTTNVEKEFDRNYVLAGDQLKMVEGRLAGRRFSPASIKMSSLAVFRNYDRLIKSLGGVQVNTTVPDSLDFVTRNGGNRRAILDRMHIDDLNANMPNEIPTFVQYLIRTPASNIWISYYFFNDDNSVGLIASEEKPMEQNVGVVTSETKPAH